MERMNVLSRCPISGLFMYVCRRPGLCLVFFYFDIVFGPFMDVFFQSIGFRFLISLWVVEDGCRAFSFAGCAD